MKDIILDAIIVCPYCNCNNPINESILGLEWEGEATDDGTNTIKRCFCCGTIIAKVQVKCQKMCKCNNNCLALAHSIQLEKIERTLKRIKVRLDEIEDEVLDEAEY